MKGTKKWGRGVWLRVLTFVLLSIVKHQTAKIISNTENFWSFLEQYIANIFFPCGYRHSIYNITYHTSQRPPFPSKVNETWAGSQPFQYGFGDYHPTQNANPQNTGHHWGVCGLFILCKKNAPWGLNPHLHALVAELHYHDGAALQAGADGCCAVGSS